MDRGMRRLLITAPRQPLTIQRPPQELYPEPALALLPRGNVRQVFTGCPHQEDKPAGVWLMRERILAEADTAAMLPMAILIILLHQPPEDITVAAELGILFRKGALTALVREDFHGTDQNAYHSLRQAIPEEATIIIIPQI